MKKFKTIFYCIVAATLSSCNTSISSNSDTAYFDIPNFIKLEAEKLQKLDPLITKTVSNEKSTESKQVKVSNWQKELAQFANIDVNKSGDIDFIKEKRGDTLIFNAPFNSKIKVDIKIIFNEKQPIELQIYKETKNLLFINKETLHYSTGKFYSIDKQQQVKGMGKNRYLIKGEIHP